MEYPLKSGDCIDVVFDLPDRIIGVEVKSSRSGDDDLLRGLYQCVKYKAVLNAENEVGGNNKKISLYLVIEGSLNMQLKKVNVKLGVSVHENIKTIS